jgi:hypothetical protein
VTVRNALVLVFAAAFLVAAFFYGADAAGVVRDAASGFADLVR